MVVSTAWKHYVVILQTRTLADTRDLLWKSHSQTSSPLPSSRQTAGIPGFLASWVAMWASADGCQQRSREGIPFGINNQSLKERLWSLGLAVSFRLGLGQRVRIWSSHLATWPTWGNKHEHQDNLLRVAKQKEEGHHAAIVPACPASPKTSRGSGQGSPSLANH